MPTKLPRHAITETPEVASALDAVRAVTGEQRLNLAELVILGAGVKAEAAREATRALDDLADMVRSGSLPVDLDAADQARRSWARSA